jgi:hypothetical protein
VNINKLIAVGKVNIGKGRRNDQKKKDKQRHYRQH